MFSVFTRDMASLLDTNSARLVSMIVWVVVFLFGACERTFVRLLALIINAPTRLLFIHSLEYVLVCQLGLTLYL